MRLVDLLEESVSDIIIMGRFCPKITIHPGYYKHFVKEDMLEAKIRKIDADDDTIRVWLEG